MHSLILSEPIGVAIGIVAGRYGAKVGKKLAKKNDIPEVLGAIFGAFLIHYLTSVIVKGLINAGMLDLPGAGVNVAITSPLAAGGHGMFEGLLELFPELGNMIENVVKNDLTTLLEEVNNEVNLDTANHFQNTSGGETYFGRSNPDYPIEMFFADSQGIRPTCGYETIENMIQMFNPTTPNYLSDFIIDYLSERGLEGINHSQGLPMQYYDQILAGFNIPSEWIDLDRKEMFNTVFKPGNSVAVVGDPSYLNDSYVGLGNSYPSNGSYHAITLTDPWMENGIPKGYFGIDSNFGGHKIKWTFEQIENMVINAKTRWHKVLITKILY